MTEMMCKMSNEFSDNTGVKNRPLYNGKIRPVALVAHVDSQRNYVNADQITAASYQNLQDQKRKGNNLPGFDGCRTSLL